MVGMYEAKRRFPSQSPTAPTAGRTAMHPWTSTPDPARQVLAHIVPPLPGLDAALPHGAEDMSEDRRRYFESTRTQAMVRPLRNAAPIQRLCRTCEEEDEAPVQAKATVDSGTGATALAAQASASRGPDATR